MHTLDRIDALQNALNESNRHHAALNGALVITLIDKGILTREEFERAYAQATATIDQEAARLRDQTE
jgi:hypothetical protein